MTNLDELLRKYNPNGVSPVKLGDVLDYEQPSKYIVSSSEYDDNYDIPVLTAGQSFILGYTDETDGVYKASKKNPTIIFDDFTTGYHWVDFDFKVKSSAMKMLRLRDNNSLLRYVFHSMALINYVPSEHSRQWISKYSQFEIPIPHIKVQEEIVEILDSFTNLIDTLNEELSLRQKQFEYYREKLLTFDDKSINVNITPLGEIGNVCMCKRIMRNETNNEGGIPFYKIGTFGGIADSFISKDKFEEYKNKYNYPKLGDILISASGTIGKTVVFDGKPSYYQDSNIVWIDNDETKVINSFLRYIYTVIDWKVDDGGVIKRLYNTNIRSTLITYPKEKAVQQSIVEKLDAFESLISSLKEEIALRQKQYEYYREKLLTFD